MSSNAAGPATLDDAPEDPRPAPGTAGAIGRPATAAALAPAAAALVALVVHQLIPARVSPVLAAADVTQAPPAPDWAAPYPLLLEALAAASLLAAAVQAAWRPLRTRVAYYGPLLAGALAVVCLYDLVAAKLAWMPQPFFPGPDKILAALVEDRATLWDSTWHSLVLLLCGYAAGVAAGLVSGVLVGWSRRARYWGMPVLKVLGPVPATALVPLAMTLFPESFPGAAALIGFAVWFPVTMLTSSGVANVRLSYLDVARTLGAGRAYLIFRVAVPSALPGVFVGLFMGLGAAFLTLIVAETVGVRAGLGWYLKTRQGFLEYANVYAALVIMAAVFSALMTLLFRVRDRVLRWQKGVIKW